MRTLPFGLIVAGLIGCGKSGPATTDTRSSSIPTLDARVEFLQRYVAFRRGYEELEFHIEYHNNSGGLPGPSDWDVRVVARVPAGELNSWVPTGIAPANTADTTWLERVPGAINSTEITEWYVEPNRVTGIDRKRAIVAHRIWTN